MRPRNGGTPAQECLTYPFVEEVTEGLGRASGYIGPEYGMAKVLNEHYSASRRAMIVKRRRAAQA